MNSKKQNRWKSIRVDFKWEKLCLFVCYLHTVKISSQFSFIILLIIGKTNFALDCKHKRLKSQETTSMWLFLEGYFGFLLGTTVLHLTFLSSAQMFSLHRRDALQVMGWELTSVNSSTFCCGRWVSFRDFLYFFFRDECTPSQTIPNALI